MKGNFIDNEERFGFHSEYYINPDWRKQEFSSCKHFLYTVYFNPSGSTGIKYSILLPNPLRKEELFMKNRESLKKRLQNTDDETLAKLITALSAASGISEEKKNALISDIPRLRRLLTETDEGQLSALMTSLGIESAADALKKLNGGSR